jgi:hypothetical protein
MSGFLSYLRSAQSIGRSRRCIDPGQAQKGKTLIQIKEWPWAFRHKRSHKEANPQGAVRLASADTEGTPER